MLARTARDKLYGSLEDGNFVPDSMVPGLSPAAPPRSRQNGAMLSDIDDSMQFGGQRDPPQMYQGLHQASMSRKGGIPLQSSKFSGDPSPNPMWPSAQPLPPGLANLGGRPHGPAQFVNLATAIPVGLRGTVLNTSLREVLSSPSPWRLWYVSVDAMELFCILLLAEVILIWRLMPYTTDLSPYFMFCWGCSYRSSRSI
ncbi:hypothetical protein DFJ58DRAFT_734341 [Suillus subalutaceus]|uniref:uncharacterized protein n=1 Tax=Suillus subalutaceus TaxID=48586 RepID=UPI001B861544|nr:uncharacterized protein DFJ58DRAFT_734341 [Suillus subalutaceus]KAG1837448.1 hypothetical protein DFJ58DRAFT_734341 [Suillus subalutaceus]